MHFLTSYNSPSLMYGEPKSPQVLTRLSSRWHSFTQPSLGNLDSRRTAFRLTFLLAILQRIWSVFFSSKTPNNCEIPYLVSCHVNQLLLYLSTKWASFAHNKTFVIGSVICWVVHQYCWKILLIMTDTGVIHI